MKKIKLKRRGPKYRNVDQIETSPIGNAIREYRINNAVGLAELASKLGFSVQYISNIENGRAPFTWDRIQDLADVIGADYFSLFEANLHSSDAYKKYEGALGAAYGVSFKRAA